MEWSNLRHRQINEKMARVVNQFEICVTMSWFGMVANGTALTFPCSTNVTDCPSDNRGVMSSNSPDSPLQKSAWRQRHIDLPFSLNQYII